jgi:two-component sensor histidine kinase
MRCDQVAVSPDRCWRTGLIVAELIRNSSRHGFAGTAGMILIDITETPAGFACRVSDNGRARQSSVPGRGISLLHDLSREMGGEITWSFFPYGTTAELLVPHIDPVAL